MAMDKREPIAWITNISGPHHHRGGLQTPLHGTVPIYTREQLNLFTGALAGNYKVRLAGEKPPPREMPPEPKGLPEGVESPFAYVQLHAFEEGQDTRDAKVELADGSILTLRQVIEALTVDDRAIMSGGWIKLYPDGNPKNITHKSQGWGNLVEELKLNPALFAPAPVAAE